VAACHANVPYSLGGDQLPGPDPIVYTRLCTPDCVHPNDPTVYTRMQNSTLNTQRSWWRRATRQAPNTSHLTPHASHLTLDTQHSTLNTQHSTLDTQHSTLDTQHSTQLVVACHAADVEPFMEVSDATQVSPDSLCFSTAFQDLY